MSIIKLEKMLFWIQKGQNVMFRGKHGVGKTSMILQAFEAAGLNYRYFSAATMDPFIDFCGVPLKVEENGNTKIKMILPETIDPEKIEALFLDEYNRCLTGDTKIQLADGTFSKIEDLKDKKYFYTYSYDIHNNKVVVAKAHSARMTEKNAPIYEVTLDNGSVIRCTGNHPFLLSNGKYKRADNLEQNESLMCLFKKYNNKGYELVSATKQPKWIPTYHLADEYNIRNNIYTKSAGDNRHHKNFNKFDNSPENIERLTRLDHLKVHSENKESCSNGGKKAHQKHPDLTGRTILTEESKKKAIKNSINTRKTSKSYKKLRSDLSKKMYSESMRDSRSEITKKQWENGQFENINRKMALQKTHINKTINFLETKGFSPRSITLEKYEEIRSDMKKQNPGKGSGILTEKKIKEYFNTFENFISHWESLQYENTTVMNHRVISVKKIGNEDVWDITVDKYHNFALESGVFVHNSHKRVRNATMELIQFKSINGRVFPKLKIIWVAVNPDDDESEEYDVERMDPAQADRFHVHVDIPYRPDKAYFNNKYGKQMADAAVEWWGNLNPEIQDKVSPRRLDYALQMHQEQGDIADVLPKESNSTQLKQFLGRGSLLSRLREIMNDKDEAEGRKILADPFYGDAAYEHIVKKEFSDFYAGLVPEEIISKAFSSPRWQPKLTKFFIKELAEKGVNKSVVDNLLKAGTLSHTQTTSLKKRLAKAGYTPSTLEEQINIMKSYLNDCDSSYSNHSLARTQGYLAIDKIMKTSKSKEYDEQVGIPELIDIFNLLVDIKARAQNNTINKKMPRTHAYFNIVIKQLIEKGVKQENFVKNSKNSSLKKSAKWPFRFDKYTQKWGKTPYQEYCERMSKTQDEELATV